MLLHVGTGYLLLRFAWPRAGSSRRHEIAVGWSRDLLSILAIQVKVEGTPPPAEARGAMIAANHVSWADIFAIASVRHTQFIAKSEIRDWPVAGWLAEKSGTIFIHRARRRDTGRINALVHASLASGECVGLFPEGTTTEGDQLLKFHSSIFEPAVSNRAPIYPVAVRYEHPDGSLCRAAAYVGELSFAQSLGLVIRTRATVARLRFADPIDPEGQTRQGVAAQAHSRVGEMLGIPATVARPEPRGASDAVPP